MLNYKGGEIVTAKVHGLESKERYAVTILSPPLQNERASLRYAGRMTDLSDRIIASTLPPRNNKSPLLEFLTCEHTYSFEPTTFNGCALMAKYNAAWNGNPDLTLVKVQQPLVYLRQALSIIVVGNKIVPFYLFTNRPPLRVKGKKHKLLDPMEALDSHIEREFTRKSQKEPVLTVVDSRLPIHKYAGVIIDKGFSYLLLQEQFERSSIERRKRFARHRKKR